MIPPPPMLPTAALLLWGWQTGMWLWVPVLALPLEGARWIRRRWDLSDDDTSRLSDICTVLVLGTLVYLLLAPDNDAAIYKLIPWLPVHLFPLVAGQRYSERGRINLRAVSLVMRRKKRKKAAAGPVPPPILVDLQWPYLVVCILAASFGNTRDAAFYIAAVILAIWMLWLVRPGGRSPALWGLLMGVAVAGGYVGHHGIHRTQLVLEEKAVQWFYQMVSRDADPYKAMTALGYIGELKPLNDIRFRVRQDGAGALPILLREAAYNHYRGTRWIALESDFAPVAGKSDDRIHDFGPVSAPERSLEIAIRMRDGNGVLKLPVGTFSIHSIPLTDVSRNPYGAVKVVKGPYLLNYRALFGPVTVMDQPPVPADLEIPGIERPAVESVAARLDLKKADRDRVPGLLDAFFTRHFQYSLELDPKREPTPLAYFLNHTHSGHCEYFATATVLLLRAAGIPARYAVGYSVHEPALLTDWYLVRSRHAHAWALAFLDGRWVNVDTTPGSWREIEGLDPSPLQLFSDIWDSITFQLLKWQWRETEADNSRYVLWLLIPLILILGRNFLRRRKKRAGAAKTRAGAGKAAPPGMDSPLYQIETWLAGRELIRPDGEPMRRWLLRLAREQVIPEAPSPLLEIHYRYRFDPAGISAGERQKLEEGVKTWLAEAEENIENRLS